MDALALLCTLHADGPTTWRKLRENGCHKLSELARFGPEELAAMVSKEIAAKILPKWRGMCRAVR